MEELFKKAIKDLYNLDKEVIFTVPKDKNITYDLCTTIAMQIANSVNKTPHEVALEIVNNLPVKNDYIESIEVTKSGYINIKVFNKYYSKILQNILSYSQFYGKENIGYGEKVQVEFVSANPTGPLHVGHCRNAILGDIISNILSYVNYDVQREYYINDAGNQIDNLIFSVWYEYLKIYNAEDRVVDYSKDDMYKGNYIVTLANMVNDKFKDSLLQEEFDYRAMEKFKDLIINEIMNWIKKTLNNLGITFDNYFSELDLFNPEYIRVLDKLEKEGYIYRTYNEEEGYVKLFFKSTLFGDDKDRSLLRNSDTYSYFTSDILYLYDKFIVRKFDKVINVLGADHHGYVKRLKGVTKALGKKQDDLEVVLIQLVNLLKDGQIVPMGKRDGNYVTIDSLLEKVNKDVIRYFFIMRNKNSTLDFDLDLATKDSKENPVYFIQYAYARICSIFRKFEGNLNILVNNIDYDLNTKRLISKLAEYPFIIRKTVQDLEPQYIASYVYEIAKRFNIFYENNKVLDNEDQMGRLQICEATKIIIKSCLTLLGISTPERM